LAVCLPIRILLPYFLTMVSPLSQVLLWLAPFSGKGGVSEWVMLAFHLGLPLLLLVFLWRGRMTAAVSFRREWPVFAVPTLFHLSDIYWTVAGGHTGILWLVLLSSLFHLFLLAFVYFRSRAVPAGALGLPA